MHGAVQMDTSVAALFTPMTSRTPFRVHVTSGNVWTRSLGWNLGHMPSPL